MSKMCIPLGLSQILATDRNFNQIIQENEGTNPPTIGDLHRKVGRYLTRPCMHHNSMGGCKRGGTCYFDHNHIGPISTNTIVAYLEVCDHIKIKNDIQVANNNVDLRQSTQSKIDIEEALVRSQARIRILENDLNDAREYIQERDQHWSETSHRIIALKVELINAQTQIQTKDHLQQILLDQLAQRQDSSGESNKRSRYE
jgi:hypothetical protein